MAFSQTQHAHSLCLTLIPEIMFSISLTTLQNQTPKENETDQYLTIEPNSKYHFLLFFIVITIII